MIQQTSLDAYIELQNNNKLNANETIVFDVFKAYPCGLCNDEAAQILGWEINRVTGRTNSLVKKGKLFALGEKINIRTRRRSIVWACKQYYNGLEKNERVGFISTPIVCLHSSGDSPLFPNPLNSRHQNVK